MANKIISKVSNKVSRINPIVNQNYINNNLILPIVRNKNWNKKALEDSLFTWIIAFGVIVFIMVLYFVFLSAVFGKDKLTSDVEIVFEESNVNLELNSRFLSFLNSKISVDSKLVDGKEEKNEKIIDVIRNSLNPYFEIKNDKEENLISKYGIKVLTENHIDLQNKMLANGFDDSDWSEFVKANGEFAQGGGIKEMRKLLDKFCDKYILEIPQGIITEEVYKIGERYSGEDNIIYFYYINPLVHKTNYKGENIEIKLRISKGCL